jgi:hypothetical protein
LSNYVQSTNFATKDALSSGDPLKIVKGTEINTEFNNIATAVATKADLASPTFTGTVTAATASFSGNVTLGSSVLATPSGSAPAYLCRAWVNFNGTGTVAIRASGNVSSITDNSTGNYTVNFTTAMPDANYSWGLSAGGGDGSEADTIGPFAQAPTTSTFRFVVEIGDQTDPADRAFVSAHFIR